ncbi:hypothetical protein CAPTEDRAFT_107964 [Capitella teleta]|uniref:Multifunctional methyltransferase subunit TRM112-like protein n=1 Tax=Capitella teleta TaxID=283909 RepID=R7VJP6_CAPTE|nr:hypothetical protein CAPTEDRAFT_107964 [Capitella teleta]|eukprot:ELU16090.1 hypothetical protein CAPTEDRAFT_107964 [Capitella teleta]
MNSPQASDVQLIDVDFNPEFITRMIPKINWKVLHEAAQSLGHANDLPAELNAEYEADQEFLKKTHHVLLEVCLIKQSLSCFSLISIIIIFQLVVSLKVNTSK